MNSRSSDCKGFAEVVRRTPGETSSSLPVYNR
jgi:hypothetical protein